MSKKTRIEHIDHRALQRILDWLLDINRRQKLLLQSALEIVEGPDEKKSANKSPKN